MKRAKTFLAVLLACIATVCAQPTTDIGSSHTVKASQEALTTRITFYAPGIVRVTKHPENIAQHRDSSLSVVMTPEAVRVKSSETASTLTLKSSTLTVRVDKATGSVTFATATGTPLLRERQAAFTPRASGADRGAYVVRQSFVLDKEEAIYGLGIMQNGKMNLRGENRKMMQSNLEDYAHVMQSIKGYGLFWDNYSPTDFNDSEQETSFTSEVGHCVNYYFLWGEDNDGVVAQLRRLTGDVPMMPLWSYGFWQSRERYRSQAEIVEVVRRYRELGVPLDGIIQDWQYWGSNYLWNAMDFLNEEFPNPQKMVDDIKALNAHSMISIWSSFGPQTLPYKELEAKGHLLDDVKTWPPHGPSTWPPRSEYPSGVRLYDPYSREARDIYWQHLTRLYALGIESWWMDSTDPDHVDAKEADYEVQTAMGSWRSVRNAFPLVGVGGVYDHIRQQPDAKRVFILTRSYFAGQQRYAANVWSGDVISDWKVLRAQVPAGLNYTLTGAPHFNTDIGGFFANRYNEQGGSGPGYKSPRFQELYVRWLQYALYNPMMRSHGTEVKREIYQFGQPGETIYEAIRSGIKQRYALLPYIYSTAWDVTNERGSFMRALFMEFPKDKQTWDCNDQFLFGKSVMAAPVLHAQYTDEEPTYSETPVDFTAPKSQEVYLPQGCAWYDLWTNSRHEGGQTIEVATTIDKAPTFVREGSILPVGPDVQWIGQKPWDELEIRIYPGSDASFTLYEDDGESYDYEQGKRSTIRFSWNDRSRRLTIEARQGAYDGMLQKRTFRVVVVNAETPAFGTPVPSAHVVSYVGKRTSVKL
ncbi:MAG: DUF5110 domain-containing protein [Bacteroides sp.]|nr:DUF5110 domain-containing protein [Bacteroides sp.]